MKFEITDIHINEYISGELTGNDLVEFKKLLVTDEALQQKIKVHRQIDEVLSENYFEVNRFNQAEYDKEKKRLNLIFTKMNKKYFVKEKNIPKKPSIIRRLLPFVALAAAATLLFFVFNPFVNNLSPTQLADQYFESYTSGTLMGEDPILVDSPKILLEKGSNQYEANQIEQAIQTFQQVADNSSLIYQNEANWYLALCYLKQNKPEMAKPLLNQLQQSTDFGIKSKAILKQLE